MNNKYGEEFPPIGAPAFRAISSIGITHLSDLTKYTEKELLNLHGFGPKALRLLKEALSKKELTFTK
jgi:DNA-directed RNA polymerase alpha subunit